MLMSEKMEIVKVMRNKKDGHTSYLVHIPKEFVDAIGLQSTRHVKISLEGKRLIMDPIEEAKK